MCEPNHHYIDYEVELNAYPSNFYCIMSLEVDKATGTHHEKDIAH